MSFASVLPDALIGDPAGLALRRLVRADLDALAAIMADPEIVRWYGPADQAVEEIAAHLADGVVTPFLIVERGTAIGYLQAYHANADDFWPGFGVPRETFGLDLSIGGAANRGRGVGAAAIRLMVERLWAIPEIVRLQIDPDPSNAPAIRAYETTGFVRRFEGPGYDGAPMVYMTMERAGQGVPDRTISTTS